jgi:hypothetical protein
LRLGGDLGCRIAARPAHRAKKTKAFAESLGGALRLVYLPPMRRIEIPTNWFGSISRPIRLGCAAIQSFTDFKAKVKSSMHSLQRNAQKICSFFQKDTLIYAA